MDTIRCRFLGSFAILLIFINAWKHLGITNPISMGALSILVGYLGVLVLHTTLSWPLFKNVVSDAKKNPRYYTLVSLLCSYSLAILIFTIGARLLIYVGGGDLQAVDEQTLPYLGTLGLGTILTYPLVFYK
jgi:hypothetical protein